MTLTTRAEHEFGRDVDHAYDEAKLDGANPYSIAENAVIEATEGATEADPARVDVEELARESAAEAREAMTDAAGMYGGSAVAEAAGERAFEAAWEYVEELCEAWPVAVEA